MQPLFSETINLSGSLFIILMQWESVCGMIEAAYFIEKSIGLKLMSLKFKSQVGY